MMDILPPEEKQSITKLCGYLNKLGSKGLMKSFKKRWFAFSDNTCKLYYFRSPGDTEHLGEIDIAIATFSFEVNSKDRPGLFYISTPDRSHELEAKDRQTALFWLQELQKRRKEFSIRRTSLIDSCKVSGLHSVGKPESGLLRCSSQSNMIASSSVSTLLEPVECPKGVIGDEAAEKDSHINFRTFSFSSLKEHVVNSVANRKQNRHSGEVNPEESQLIPLNSPTKSDDKQLLDSNRMESEENNPGKLKSFKKKFAQSFRNRERILPIQTGNCKKCVQFSENISSLKDDLELMEDEVSTSREVIHALQKQLVLLSQERDTLMENANLTYEDVGILVKKDQELSELKFQISSKEKEIEVLLNQLRTYQKEIHSLNDKVNAYEEAIEMKDAVVVDLSNKISDLESGEKEVTEEFGSDDIDGLLMKIIPSPSSEMDTLKDSLQAFQIQNKFLNQEILELNQLMKQSEERENKLLLQCSEWEAKYYQIQSKYLLLLNDLHVPQKVGEEKGHNQEMVSQLLQDALMVQGHPNYTRFNRSNSETKYDYFGFSRKSEEDESTVLLSAAADMQRKSESINLSHDPDMEMWHSKWENYMLIQGNKELHRNPELKSLIRSGVPNEHKSRIWKGCIDLWVKSTKEKLKPNYYQNLLAAHHKISTLDPAAKQIELDLLRTLPNNKHYETLHSDGIPKLRRVLLAYSRHNTEVGYCQGLNRLAAIALLFMKEEDAFWCLVAIVEFIMPPDYYSKTLISSQVDQRVLKDLLADKLPRLQSHFDSCKFDLSLLTFNWFLCIFVDNIPVDVFLRIWDCVLYEGSKVLFRFALAFLKLFEEDILQKNDSMDLNRHLRSVAEHSLYARKLFQVAFHDLNPFPMRAIKSKRAFHLQVVKTELEELERIRSEFRSQTEPREEFESDDE